MHGYETLVAGVRKTLLLKNRRIFICHRIQFATKHVSRHPAKLFLFRSRRSLAPTWVDVTEERITHTMPIANYLFSDTDKQKNIVMNCNNSRAYSVFTGSMLGNYTTITTEDRVDSHNVSLCTNSVRANEIQKHKLWWNNIHAYLTSFHIDHSDAIRSFCDVDSRRGK